jgi:hypothetical protein
MKKDEILRVLIDWNFWGDYRDESIERKTYINKLNSLIKTKENIIVKGVRRAGKSTLITKFIKELIKRKEDSLIINFEDPRFKDLNLDLLNKIYEVYLEEVQPKEKHFVVLDEVQVIEKWEKFVRYLSEAKKVQVLVTGSSSKLLSEEYSTLLAGRHVDLEVFPLSFKEFLNFKNIFVKTRVDLIKQEFKIKNLLKEYLEFGGFPKVVLIEKEEKKEVLRSYFNDILIKDVQKRYNVREIEKLENLAKYYLSNISTLQSFNKLKNFTKLSLDSVERFSKYFEIARLIFLIPKFSYSIKEQILNPKKVYSIDLGLRNLISFKFSEDKGKLMENLVFLELKRKQKEVYYWKDHQQREVDFVLKDGTKVEQLIQVCYSLEDLETRKREIRGLIKASDELKCRNLLVITWDEEEEINERNKIIKVVPLWKWLLS